MRNRYPGKCYRCGGKVSPRDGHFERFDRNNSSGWTDIEKRNRWRLQHAECAIKFRGTNTHHVLSPADWPEGK